MLINPRATRSQPIISGFFAYSSAAHNNLRYLNETTIDKFWYDTSIMWASAWESGTNAKAFAYIYKCQRGNMNCPNCGSQTLANQQFCRSCGASLMQYERRGLGPRAWAMIGLTMAFGGILLSFAGKMTEVRWVIFAGVFLSVLGMFVLAATSLLRPSRLRKQRSDRNAPPVTLERADPTNKLLPVGDNDFVPSVTENTTNLLKVEALETRQTTEDKKRQKQNIPLNRSQ
ncbi:MAG: zinc-ribbon domain-containing protein [Pyrinomonadaceae bacterium]